MSFYEILFLCSVGLHIIQALLNGALAARLGALEEVEELIDRIE